MGHLTTDAKKQETRAFCCRFSVASDRRYKRDGKWESETVFVSCVYWNSENVFEYLQQGRQVYVEGHLISWIARDKDTQRQHTVLEVSVDELLLTDNKRGGDSGVVAEDSERVERAEAYAEELQARNAALVAELDNIRNTDLRAKSNGETGAQRGKVLPMGQKRATTKRRAGRG